MELIHVEQKIRVFRNLHVILYSDLAAFFGVTTKALNQAVKRNFERFPEEFMFELSKREWDFLRSQLVTLEGRGNFTKYLPKVFTEYGVVMVSSILKSREAIEMNINIVKTFIHLRSKAITLKNIETTISDMEIKTNSRLLDIEYLLDYLISEKNHLDSQMVRTKIGFNK